MYAVSLKVAELSTVTFGWIVTLQVGLLLLERIRYAVELANGKWAAIVAILVLQAYLIWPRTAPPHDRHRGPRSPTPPRSWPRCAATPRTAWCPSPARPRARPGGGRRAAGPHLGFHPALPEGAMAADGEALLGQALAPGEVIDPEVVDHLLACRRAQVHICGPDDPALDRVAVIDGG